MTNSGTSDQHRGPSEFLRPVAVAVAGERSPDAERGCIDAKVPFVTATQQGNKLCWAAVAYSVAVAYGCREVPLQCDYARIFLRPPSGSCCPEPREMPGCDKRYCVARALAYCDNLEPQAAYPPQGLDVIQRDLKDGRVVVFELSTELCSGHLVVATGITAIRNECLLGIEDPIGEGGTNGGFALRDLRVTQMFRTRKPCA